MPLAEQRHADVRELVDAWRLEQLLQAGYRHHRAELLAASDVDLHTAISLLEQGCDQRTALRILL